MQYEFKDLNKTTSASSGKSVESLTFNGINLESEIDEFRTVSVDGRDNYSRKLSTSDSFGDGEFFLRSKIEKNTISVVFFLIAETTEQFNRAFTRLKLLLQGDEKEFYFADEPEFTRIGTVTKLTNGEPGSLSVKGTIEITMSDPYRHGQTKTIDGQNVVYINDPQLTYRQNVDSIVVNVGESSTNEILLTIGNDWRLKMNGSFPSSSTIVLNINDRSLTVNGNSALNTIDIMQTNIFEATIEKGSQVRCSQAAKMTVEYRVKQL
ncbi:distal tail protein Dit [Fructobacillus fructosus]|uniref:distal tail protein Dit n=1 Tax=Fructobacillus fructosus TaxID=1631 RepID=UPI004034D495